MWRPRLGWGHAAVVTWVPAVLGAPCPRVRKERTKPVSSACDLDGQTKSRASPAPLAASPLRKLPACRPFPPRTSARGNVSPRARHRLLGAERHSRRRGEPPPAPSRVGLSVTFPGLGHTPSRPEQGLVGGRKEQLVPCNGDTELTPKGQERGANVPRVAEGSDPKMGGRHPGRRARRPAGRSPWEPRCPLRGREGCVGAQPGAPGATSTGEEPTAAGSAAAPGAFLEAG